jgi:hypothetical protein
MENYQPINKQIKNEQWYVKNLINRIYNGDISKPKYQRKRKWDILPKKENIPSEKKYIEFLFETQNSVHAITFGQKNNVLSNIDGNNRINAIHHFLTEPFCIFPEYLTNINEFIEKSFKNDINLIKEIKDIFNSLSYNDLVNFKYNHYFINNRQEDLYHLHLKILRDDFEPIIEDLQKKCKINSQDNFDTNVKININLFEGYTTEELCKIFEDINKFNCRLTETELLACRLYTIDDFYIKDKIIEVNIKGSLQKYYSEKKENEVLNCYEYQEEDSINAYDFIVGLQIFSHNSCDIIETVNNDGLSLFFKIYKTIFKGGLDTTFNTNNVNLFIEYIKFSVGIMKDITERIFMEKLTGGGKVFDACNKKLYSLKRNNIYLILVSIIGFYKQGTDKEIILNSIEKCLLYHFFINDIIDKEKREEYKISDSLHYEAGGSYIDNIAGKMLENPILICNKVNEKCIKELLNIIVKESIKPKIEKKINRRNRKFFEKALIYYYYKTKVPIEYLKHNYWIEHIFPFSSSFLNELDIDRLGNIIPIIDSMNNIRGNKHIDEYDSDQFIKFINDIIPSKHIYNSIVKHTKKKPCIIDIEKFNDFCVKNEDNYINNFILNLFP